MTNSVTNRLTMYASRIDRLRQTLQQLSLDALLVTNPENRRYLSGFTGEDSGIDSAGALIVTGSRVLLLTDARYLEQAEREAPGLEIKRREAGQAPLAAQELMAAGVTRAGVEANHIRLALFLDLEKALAGPGDSDGGAEPRPFAHVELVSTRDLVEEQRVVKDTFEIEAIERASAITDETFAYLCGYLRPGITERQVAQEIERYMLSLGADGLAFDSIVATGPNSALPHAVPSNREVGVGELITIDMGAKYDGYCSDMTRTICLGGPGPELQELYDLVLEAQERCELGLHPGLNGKQADALARDFFEERGRGAEYLHSTGHGLGLEIHENPRLSKFGEDSLLEPGMAITIEPGLYIAGVGGVRIEDTALITEHGLRILSTAPKRLQLPL
ncbi:MAG: M24 family metallopeptidase [Ktedonobacterales bacterium]